MEIRGWEGGVEIVQSDLEHIKTCCCTAGTLTARTGPHTRSLSGLYIPDPRGRHVLNDCVNGYITLHT